MTLSEFINKYNSQYVDFDGKYGAQCVDLARQYIKEVLKYKQPAGVQGAKNFFENFEKDSNLTSQFIKIPNTLTLVFQPGDIVIWNGKYGLYGHIAICTYANVICFNAFSQNDPANSRCTVKKYTYNKVYGVLRPKN